MKFYGLCRMIMQTGPGIRENLGLKEPPGFFAVLFVLLRIFKWVYIIKRDGSTVGMLGAYYWEPGRSAVLTMVIWNSSERGRGTGSRALGLAVRELSRRRLCMKFFVEVKKANKRAIRFWKKNRFMETDLRNGTVVLCLRSREPMNPDYALQMPEKRNFHELLHS